MFPRSLIRACTPFLLAGATCFAQSFRSAPAHFWFYARGAEASSMCDDQALQLIARHGAFFTPRIEIECPLDTMYAMRSVARRAHRWAPDLPVLLYTYTTCDDSTGNDPRYPTFLPDYVLRGFQQLDTLLLYDGAGRHVTYSTAWDGDVRKPEYRAWVIGRIRDSLERYGLDGINNDIVVANGHASAMGLCPTGAEPFCTEWTDGVLALTGDLKAAIGSKLYVFNGLKNGKGDPQLIPDQLRMLPLTDGAVIEFWGYSHNGAGDSSFTTMILPYLDQIRNNPDSRIFVCGRMKADPYVGYDDDVRWERYLYGAYLLVRDPNTTFHAFVEFAFPSAYGGRSSVLDWYADQDLDFGTPLGDYGVQGKVYYRMYSGGMILVLPDDAGGPATVNLPASFYTPEGELLSGRTTIQPGTGLLLLSAPPQGRADSVALSFDGGASEPCATWGAAEIRAEGGDHYLHVDALPEQRRQLHDLMLDWVRALRPPGTLRFRVRTADPSARFHVIADVEDSLRQYMQVVFDVRFDGIVPPEHLDTLVQFRMLSVPLGANTQNQKFAPCLSVSGGAADGTWREVSLPGDSLLAGTRYTFRRFAFARMVGSMDVDDVTVRNAGGAVGRASDPAHAPDVAALSVYPDPSDGSVRVVLDPRLGRGTVSVSTVLGEVLCTASFSALEARGGLSFTALPPGTYFLTVRSAGGTATEKFVVRR